MRTKLLLAIVCSLLLIISAVLLVPTSSSFAAKSISLAKRALNADNVDGLSASRSPQAGQLIALGSNKKLPASVLPAGTRGPQGDQGPPGERGPQGFQGPQGNRGAQGDQGIQGRQGTQGSQGEQGEQGPQGAKGDSGEQGIDGKQGIQGIEGPQGPQGAQGIQGLQGIQGPIGVDGPQGVKGDTGLRGLQGERGPEGPQGPQGVQGVRGPSGVDGSMGPQGPQGVQGITGPQGVQGERGPEGPQGSQGIKGDAGVQGPTGPAASIGTVEVWQALGGIAPVYNYPLATMATIAINSSGNLVASKTFLANIDQPYDSPNVVNGYDDAVTTSKPSSTVYRTTIDNGSTYGLSFTSVDLTKAVITTQVSGPGSPINCQPNATSANVVDVTCSSAISSSQTLQVVVTRAEKVDWIAKHYVE